MIYAMKKPPVKIKKSPVFEHHFSMLQAEKDFTRWLSKDIAVLDYFAGDTGRVPRELWVVLETLRVKKGKDLFVELLYALTHQYFPPEDARRLWGSVVEHKRDLCKKLGRDVGMKVASLDYLNNQTSHIPDLQLLPEKDLDSLLLFANEDGLTGLYNHRYFQERLRYEVARCQRYRHAFSLLFADLDHFKQYNDSYGHLKGDILLRDIGSFFKAYCRQADVVARYGGDEFAFILPETSGPQATLVAQRLQANFRKRRFGSPVREVTTGVTLSVGIGVFPKNGSSAEALIESADRALYRAKQEGRDRTCLAKSGRKT
jgi:diguanylate cyclase (GGDEF)-like protein